MSRDKRGFCVPWFAVKYPPSLTGYATIQLKQPSSIDMPEKEPSSAKRSFARVRFGNDTHRIVLSDYYDKMRDFPPPSPAPAHLQRHKPAYRTIIRTLEMLVLCLAAVILVLVAVWTYHLARQTYSSNFWVWKRELLEKLQAEGVRTSVRLESRIRAPRALPVAYDYSKGLTRKMLTLNASPGSLAQSAAFKRYLGEKAHRRYNSWYHGWRSRSSSWPGNFGFSSSKVNRLCLWQVGESKHCGGNKLRSTDFDALIQMGSVQISACKEPKRLCSY